MKIINKTMDLKDLNSKKAKIVIKELVELNKLFEKNNCCISSWFGDCNPTKNSIKFNLANRGYDYKSMLDYELDLKYPTFLLWEIYWVYSNLHLKEKSLVLDIGGACSLFSFYLASKGMKVVAIDINQKIVDEANRIAKVMNLNYEAICMDAEEYLKSCNLKFDCITSICVFEHIEKNKRKRIVENIHKCLTKDGLVAFTFDYKNPSKFVEINNEDDIKEQLTSNNLRIIGNKEFYDNNINYLISLFYRKPALWRYKFHFIREKEFSKLDFFKVRKENDYTFGAIFQKNKPKNIAKRK